MKIALFGGTFDPIHSGHLSAAMAAQSAFALDEIRFVPTGVPPHKRARTVTAFADRYAMVALACNDVPHLAPSRLEDPEHHGGKPNYSIDTIRRFHQQLTDDDHLYFLIGVDAFLDIPTWRDPVALLDSCDFIVVSRPGFDIGKIRSILPAELRSEKPSQENRIDLRRTSVHLLTTVEADISSSNIRQRSAHGESLTGLVPQPVADYIKKRNIYAQETYAEKN